MTSHTIRITVAEPYSYRYNASEEVAVRAQYTHMTILTTYLYAYLIVLPSDLYGCLITPQEGICTPTWPSY